MRYLITTCICTCLTQIRSVFKHSKCILLQNQETKGSSDFQLHSFLSDETSPAVSDDKIKQRSKSKSKEAKMTAASISTHPQMQLCLEVSLNGTDTSCRDGKCQLNATGNGTWPTNTQLFVLSDQRLPLAQEGLWLRNRNCATKERKTLRWLMYRN